MLKILPQPEIKSKEDIESFFKARKITFEPSPLKKELYRQLGLSELLEPIKSIQDMAHKRTNLSFFLILQNEHYCLKYQYLDSEITFKDGKFSLISEPLKEGFQKFNGDEVCSFLEYCIEDNLEFSILSSKKIDKDLLINAK
jgi:hypothetical protein